MWEGKRTVQESSSLQEPSEGGSLAPQLYRLNPNTGSWLPHPGYL